MLLVGMLVLLLPTGGCGGGEQGSGSASATPAAAGSDGQTGDATTADSEQPGEQVISTGGPIGPPVQTEGGKGLPSCADMNTPISKATLSTAATAARCIINGLRRRRGIRKLKDNAKLRTAASKHAKDMVSKGYFSHVSKDGRTFVARISSAGYTQGATAWTIGENLAWGTGSRSTPASIVQAWLDSPGHRKNMFNRRYREAGMAVAAGAPTRSASAGASGTYVDEFGTTSH
jgi:uncharacterized protein YkwD